LAHDCPYSLLEGEFGVDFVPLMELESVGSGGSASYRPKPDGPLDRIVVSTRVGSGFPYWRSEAFKGA
jgi:hypothetical protein